MLIRICRGFLIFALVACQGNKELVLVADFNLLEVPMDTIQREDVGVFGGQKSRLIRSIELEGAEADIVDDHLEITFEEGGYIQMTPTSIGLPASWKKIRNMRLTFGEAPGADILLEVYGSRTRLLDTIRAGEQSFQMDVSELPLMGGLESRPLYLSLTSTGKQVLRVDQVALEEGATIPLLDQWGQRIKGDWDNKVATNDELLSNNAEENFFSNLDDLAPTDRFGGYLTEDIQFEPKGYFYTIYDNKRWWLVTPLGNPFFSLGINGVRRKSFRSNADVTRVKGRREIFEELPAYTECPECYREDSSYFSFYCWNARRKYGSWGEWKEQVYHRMNNLGFNTIGNWSDTLFYQEARMPYTFTLDSRGDTSLRMANGLPDVFNSDWLEHLDSTFAEIQRFREDSFLLGYFVDNEMRWRDLSQVDSSSKTFSALSGISNPRERFARYAARYFSSVRDAIRKYDSTHLYLGCRFTRNFDSMHPIAAEAGKYADVLSINVYSAYPVREEMNQWYDAAQLPLLIGEHHIPPRTSKQLWPHYPNFLPEERDEMLANYLITWANYPYAVGSHWYQFKDQAVAGRGEGGENQPVGLVTVADKLNYDLAKTYHRVAGDLRNEWLNR